MLEFNITAGLKKMLHALAFSTGFRPAARSVCFLIIERAIRRYGENWRIINVIIASKLCKMKFF
jgi:hypothetical protein